MTANIFHGDQEWLIQTRSISKSRWLEETEHGEASGWTSGFIDRRTPKPAVKVFIYMTLYYCHPAGAISI